MSCLPCRASVEMARCYRHHCVHLPSVIFYFISERLCRHTAHNQTKQTVTLRNLTPWGTLCDKKKDPHAFPWKSESTSVVFGLAFGFSSSLCLSSRRLFRHHRPQGTLQPRQGKQTRRPTAWSFTALGSPVEQWKKWTSALCQKQYVG